MPKCKGCTLHRTVGTQEMGLTQPVAGPKVCSESKVQAGSSQAEETILARPPGRAGSENHKQCHQNAPCKMGRGQVTEGL